MTCEVCGDIDDHVPGDVACRRMADNAERIASRSREAALTAEVERLTGCLARANADGEKHERLWYLATDEVEQLTRDLAAARADAANARAEIERLTAELAEARK